MRNRQLLLWWAYPTTGLTELNPLPGNVHPLLGTDCSRKLRSVMKGMRALTELRKGQESSPVLLLNGKEGENGKTPQN